MKGERFKVQGSRYKVEGTKGSKQPGCGIAAEELFKRDPLRPHKERPRFGILFAKPPQAGGLAAPAALHLDGPDVPPSGDHVIDLLSPLPPVGDPVFHGVEAAAQAGPDGVFHQSSPPYCVAAGVGEGSRGKGADQGVVPEEELRTASPFANLAPREYL